MTMLWNIETDCPVWDPWPDRVGAGYDFAAILKTAIERFVQAIADAEHSPVVDRRLPFAHLVMEPDA